jgi:hypothetical protein
VSARDDLRAKRRRARRNSYWLRIGRDLKAARRAGLTLAVYRALNETAYGLQVQLERELMGIPGLITAEKDYPPMFQRIVDDTIRGDVNARWEDSEITVNGDTRTVASYRGHEGPNPWLDPPPGAVIDSWMHHGACPCPACLVRDGELKP